MATIYQVKSIHTPLGYRLVYFHQYILKYQTAVYVSLLSVTLVLWNSIGCVVVAIQSLYIYPVSKF